ncbi:hypothetical protein DHB64_08515 [Antarcticibacterium sp. W02-3]|nr:hypothetical protein [Antarcticibacterium sp. W02-3]
MLFLGFCGCSYYKVNKSELQEPPGPQIEKLEPEDRYVILHSGSQMVHLNKVTVDDDKKELKGVLANIGADHKFERPVNRKSYRYRPTKENPLNEVHFYTSENLNFRVGEEVSIPFSMFDSISVNKPNAGRSIVNAAGSAVAVFAVAIVVVALTKSSCPFIYVKDGNEYVFRGELYPGAITPNIQRDDYIPLPQFDPSGDEYMIKVTNELLEIQYTDLLQLIVLEHPGDVKVLLDQKGNAHSFSKIEAPKRAISDRFSTSLPELLQQDGKSFLFDSSVETANGSRSITLEFAKPSEAKQAKLFLTAKNSYWLDYTFGKFNEQFGVYYNTFQKKQLKTAGEESTQWSKDQNIPLSVYLRTGGEWKLVEQIPTIGPLAFRDLVVPIDLGNFKEEKVVLKLETGFIFWEIDRAGMDFSENIQMTEVVLEPSFAIDEKGEDVTELLRKADQQYLIQPEVGNEVIVSFKYKPENHTGSATAFLKNRGYYTYIRDYKGLPQFAELQKFKESGRFSRFSEEQYRKFLEEDMFDFALTYAN